VKHRSNYLALAGFAALAALLFGRHALVDPTGRCVCTGPAGDPALFMWALSWWPHALGAGTNPFYSTAMWAPDGLSIASITGIPGASLAMWPITALFGPVASYNAVALLSPALSAFTSFLLCKQVTGSVRGAVVGGLLFGFGSYQLGQLLGHLNLTTVFLVPMMAYLVLRRLDRSLSRRRFILAGAATLIGQFLLSTEIAFDVVLMGGLALIVGYAIYPARRKELRVLVAETIGTGLIAMLVVSPYIYEALVKDGLRQHPFFAEKYKLDLLNLVVPTKTTLLGGSSFASVSDSYSAGLSEAGGYLGVVMLAAFVCFVVTRWRERATRFLAAASAVTLVLALGPHLAIGGHETIPLPWRLVETLPLFEAPAPVRFVLFLHLLVAVAIASWLACERGRIHARWAVACVGLVALTPAIHTGLWDSRPRTQSDALASTLFQQAVPRDSIVLPVPFGEHGYGALWQAQARFRFRIAAGYLAGPIPPAYADERVALEMKDHDRPPRSKPAFRAFLRRHQVSRVLVDRADQGAWPGFLDSLGLNGRLVGNLLVYDVL
jgi:hypothetical protein